MEPGAERVPAGKPSARILLGKEAIGRRGAGSVAGHAAHMRSHQQCVCNSCMLHVWCVQTRVVCAENKLHFSTRVRPVLAGGSMVQTGGI